MTAALRSLCRHFRHSRAADWCDATGDAFKLGQDHAHHSPYATLNDSLKVGAQQWRPGLIAEMKAAANTRHRFSFHRARELETAESRRSMLASSSCSFGRMWTCECATGIGEMSPAACRAKLDASFAISQGSCCMGALIMVLAVDFFGHCDAVLTSLARRTSAPVVYAALASEVEHIAPTPAALPPATETERDPQTFSSSAAVSIESVALASSYWPCSRATAITLAPAIQATTMVAALAFIMTSRQRWRRMLQAAPVIAPAQWFRTWRLLQS